MRDLNDLYYFAQVLDHGGFAAAGRALGMPKSKCSRRIAELEKRLGVRLIQRSTRHFSVAETARPTTHTASLQQCVTPQIGPIWCACRVSTWAFHRMSKCGICLGRTPHRQPFTTVRA